MEECANVICKYYIILDKEFKYWKFLVFIGFLELIFGDIKE